MCAEEKRNRRVPKKREQRGRRKSTFLSCLLVMCMLVIFTNNAAKTVKATDVASAAASVAQTEESASGTEETAAVTASVADTAVATAGGIAEETAAATASGIAAEPASVAQTEDPESGIAAVSGANVARTTETEAEEAAAGEPAAADADTKILYLTFDDGPSPETTEKILDILKERNIKATFFVIGENVRKNPEIAKRIVEEGHTIGIHCDVHDYETLYKSVDSYVADFEKAYDTVLSVTGVEAKLFRFPGGSINAYNKGVYKAIIAEMEARGFVYFDWNASVEDAVGGKPSPEELVQNAVDTSLGRKRVVLLAHDRVENTALALDALIDAFPEYRIEPLTEETVPVQF